MAKSAKTKTDELVALLRCKSGIKVAELSEALEWKPHTTRAALTKLRQAGWHVEKIAPKGGERASRFRIGAAKS